MKRTLLVVTSLVLVLATVAAAVLVIGPGFGNAAAGGVDPDVAAAIQQAIQADNSTFLLPSAQLPAGTSVADVATGKAAANPATATSMHSDRAAMRANITRGLSAHMTGKILTSNLNVALPWVDDMTTSGDKIFDLSKKIAHFDISTYVRQGTSATVTGTYSVRVQHAQVIDTKGHIATWGGTGTIAFTASLTDQNSQWLVSDLSETTTNLTDDPSLDSGFQVVPDGTKPPTSMAPVPVVP
jgi:hypothetical protein